MHIPLQHLRTHYSRLMVLMHISCANSATLYHKGSSEMIGYFSTHACIHVYTLTRNQYRGALVSESEWGKIMLSRGKMAACACPFTCTTEEYTCMRVCRYMRVCVCMNVCMCVCTYIYIYIYIYIHVRLSINVCIYIYIYIHVRLSINVCIYIYIYTHTYLYFHVCVYLYMHTHLHPSHAHR